MSNGEFEFLDPGPLVNGDLELVLVRSVPADPRKGYVPAYEFEMRLVPARERVGYVHFRAGNTNSIVLYGGHIGYGVDPPYRNRKYAARSCMLLFPLARRHGINPLWITCNPDNAASRRTCEIAGGKLIEIVDLPEDNDRYKEGERQKCRYRFDL